MDPAAEAKADDDFYKRHSEMVVNGERVPLDPSDPAQAGLRQEWMKDYQNHGGKVEPVRAHHVRHAKDKANKHFGSKTVAAPAQNCPLQGGKPSPAPVKLAREQRPAGNKNGGEPVCELVSASLTCEHGRKAGPEGILMVVPRSTAAAGDTVTATLKMKGGCGPHPSWSVGGYWTSEGKGASFSFNAETWLPSALGFLSLRGVSPHTYQVQVNACGGPLSFDVRAYPPGKVSAKFDVRKYIDTIVAALKHLPVEEDELDKFVGDWFQGAIEYSGRWQEDEASWKAYYDMAVTGGFDPLFGVKFKKQVYPPSLAPEWVYKWVKAGLFFEFKLGAKLQCALKGKYWPHKDESEWGEKSITGGGSGKGALSLELKLVSSDLVEGALTGEMGAGVEVEAASGEDAKVVVKLKFDGILAKATFKAAWGWVEVTREFQLVQEREHVLKEWSLTG